MASHATTALGGATVPGRYKCDSSEFACISELCGSPGAGRHVNPRAAGKRAQEASAQARGHAAPQIIVATTLRRSRAQARVVQGKLRGAVRQKQPKSVSGNAGLIFCPCARAVHMLEDGSPQRTEACLVQMKVPGGMQVSPGEWHRHSAVVKPLAPEQCSCEPTG